jgi:hypothetical protein
VLLIARFIGGAGTGILSTVAPRIDI